MVIDFVGVYKRYVAMLNDMERNNSIMTDEAKAIIRRCCKLEEWLVNAELKAPKKKRNNKENINNANKK